MAWSTQTRIEQRIRAARLKFYADKDRDGTVDPASLTQAFEFADGLCYAYLHHLGASTITAWTASTVPLLAQKIYEDIALSFLAGDALQPNPQIVENYKKSLALLEKIRDGKIDLVDRDGNVLTPSASTFAEIEVSTEDDNRVFTRELLGTPPAATHPCVFEAVDNDDSDVETTE